MSVLCPICDHSPIQCYGIVDEQSTALRARRGRSRILFGRTSQADGQMAYRVRMRPRFNFDRERPGSGEPGRPVCVVPRQFSVPVPPGAKRARRGHRSARYCLVIQPEAAGDSNHCPGPVLRRRQEIAPRERKIRPMSIIPRRILMGAKWAFRETGAERRAKLPRDSSPWVEPREISRRVIVELVVRLQTGSRSRRASAGRPFDGVAPFMGGGREGRLCHWS
jgi:hypothetical protein